jgi:ubiquinone/menaquinone biosynthesis C-methylase UbiE
MKTRIEEEIKVFDETAAYDELMARPYTRYLKKNIDDYLSSVKIKNSAIFELGCGVSEHADLFKKDNYLVLSDITYSLLKRNDPDCGRVVADAQVLPFKSGVCDLVICLGILHHLPDQYISLVEAGRVLKPGGKIFIQEPHRMSLNFFYYYGRRLFMKLFGVEKVKKMIGCFSPDEWQLDVNALKKVFKDGYRLKKWTILTFRLPPFRMFKKCKLDVSLSKFLDRLPILRHFGTTIFYEVIKKEN